MRNVGEAWAGLGRELFCSPVSCLQAELGPLCRSHPHPHPRGAEAGTGRVRQPQGLSQEGFRTQKEQFSNREESGSSKNFRVGGPSPCSLP